MIKRIAINIGIFLLCFCGWVAAQTINSSLQVSQDPRGPVALDTVGSVYFPKHVNVVNGTPTVSGTGTPTISGSDARGTVTMGTSATTATVVFQNAYNTIPDCIINSQGGIGTVSPLSYVPATTSLAITQGSTSANKITYICMSNS